MKRLLLIALALVGLASTAASATAIGVEGTGGVGGYGAVGHGGAMLLLKFDGMPYLAVGADFWQWGGGVDVTADWWIVNNQITGPLYWYFGLGPYLSMRWYDTGHYNGYYANPPAFGFTGGLRVPFGLHVFPTKWFECFFEIAPCGGVGFFAYDGTAVYPDWHIQGSLGVRFWF